MSTSTWTAVLLAPVFIFLLWTFSSTSPSSLFPFARSFPILTNSRICLLIAHPDDEAMFFSPTVLALTNPELGNHVKILCLSSGDADGLGSVRKKELEKSALHLGLRAPSDVFVVDEPSRFPDSMTTTWSAESITSLLSEAFTPQSQPQSNGNPAKKSASSKRKEATTAADKPPSATIDVLITFDRSGVSSHPNHISLYHGAVTWLRNLMKGKSGWNCPVMLYTLTSTPLVRKYVGILDAPASMILGVLDNFIGGEKRGTKADDGSGEKSKRLLFVNGPADYWRARGAMVHAHKSQMVWFRWGWITLGRYMVVNDLKRVKIPVT